MSDRIPPVIRVTIPDDNLPAQRALDIIQSLLERGHAVRRGASLPESAVGPVVALRPADADAAQEPSAACVDLDDRPAKDLVAAVEAAARSDSSASTTPWKPWFPVIDASRCTNCMQCLSFCLFDVYSVTPDRKITVANPANCKTDCPACSRVCPEVAIVFPKYKAGPINGDEVSSDDVRRESMKIDISALLGGDVYSLLRDRSQRAQSRFSKERDDQRALTERQRCLTKLQQQMNELDVPPEVLASLPSPETIREKAEAARRKAEEALAPPSIQPRSGDMQ